MSCEKCGSSEWVHYMNARRTGWLFCDPGAATIGGFPLEVVANTYRTAGRKIPRRLEDALLHSKAS